MKEQLSVMDVAKQMNSSVSKVVTATQMLGFEKAYLVADAIGELKVMLTTEYMKPIMNMQGNRLGFKADKIYDETTVKNCLIEAVLMGVQPCGNQFNIIAGNAYITKEGFGYLLANCQGLAYSIVPQLPRIKDQSGAVVMEIEWSLNGGILQKKSIDFAIKVNNFMGADAVIGKATRKARAWLYNTVTGCEIADGEVELAESKVVSSILKENVTLEDIVALYQEKKDKLTNDEKDFLDEVIEANETASFTKAIQLLKSK